MSWNILPTNDLKEHKESESCKCKPTIKIINGHKLIIHNSYDGREVIEKEIDNYIQNFQKNRCFSWWGYVVLEYI